VGTISLSAFKKLVLLGTVAKFSDGVYGAKRLQKIVYLGTRASDLKPFPYFRRQFGQYSPQLEDAKEQLLSVGLLVAEPLESSHVNPIEELAGGNKYRVSVQSQRYLQLLQKVNPTIASGVNDAVKKYGYLQEEKLIEHVYALPEFEGKKMYEVIFECCAPERISVDLSDDECEELELAFNPKFISATRALLTAAESSKMDFSRLKEVSVIQ
jgi:hypothetical protein